MMQFNEALWKLKAIKYILITTFTFSAKNIYQKDIS